MKPGRSEARGCKTANRQGTPGRPFQRALDLKRMPENPARQDPADRIHTEKVSGYNPLDPVDF